MESDKEKNEKPELKSLLTSAAFALLIGGVFFLNLFLPKPEILQSERRKPASWPKFSVSSLLSSEFMEGFAKYASDNFMFREQLRTIRAGFVFDVFLQTDKSGLYQDNAAGAGKFEKIDESSLRKAGEKIQKLCELFPELDIYYSFVPDKSVYADRYYPGFEPEKAGSVLAESLVGLEFIDLSGVLSADDFYSTDLHWDQTKIVGVAKSLGLAMGFSDRLETKFETHTAGSFQGAYTGQLALPRLPDELKYLSNDILDKTVVSYFNPAAGGWEPGPMYDLAAASGRDPYDLFLKGVQPLVTIENPNAKTDRQLYLFRDSFGSSLAPLLSSAYAKITVIDMRYIDSRLLEEYVGMPSAARSAGDFKSEQETEFEMAVEEFRNFSEGEDYPDLTDYAAIHGQELLALDEMALQRKQTSDYMIIRQMEKLRLLENILEAQKKLPESPENMAAARGLPKGGFAKENADVLFLYSSQILNNSSILLVN